MRIFLLVTVLLASQFSLGLQTLFCVNGVKSDRVIDLSSLIAEPSFELKIQPDKKNSFYVSIMERLNNRGKHILSWKKVPCYTRGFGFWKCYNRSRLILKVKNLTEDLEDRGANPIHVSWVSDRRTRLRGKKKGIEFSEHDCSYNRKTYIINYLRPGYDPHGHVIYRYHKKTNGKFSELHRGVSVNNCYEGKSEKVREILEKLLKNDGSIDKYLISDLQIKKDRSIEVSLKLERDNIEEKETLHLSLCN